MTQLKLRVNNACLNNRKTKWKLCFTIKKQHKHKINREVDRVMSKHMLNHTLCSLNLEQINND